MAKNPFDILKKSISKSSIDLDDIILKTIESSTNFEQIKNISITELIKSKDIDKNGQIKKIFEDSEKSKYSLEPDRLSKYNDYDKIMEKLPTVAAAINTLVDNTITPDNNFNNIFKYDVKNFATITPELKALIQVFKNIVQSKEIDSIIEQSAFNLAKYGCFFIEIKENTKILKSKKYKVLEDSDDKLSNIDNPQYLEERIIFDVTEDNDIIVNTFEEKYGNLIDTYKGTTINTLLEDDNDNSENDDGENTSLESLEINVLNPKNVLVVHTMGTILGYLYILPQPGQVQPNESLAKQVLNKLFKENNNVKNIRKFIEDNPQYENYIAKLLNSYDEGLGEVQTKFIPVDNMIHEYLGDKFPYGESRLESIRELAKYQIIGNNATMLYRFTRAPDIRVFKVDVGLDHDSAKYIQQIKRELMQRKYSVDMNEDVDTLSKQLTQFEDLWVPTKQGQQFFEMEILPTGDLQSKIDDLKYIRDQVTTGLDTPPSYLGIERQEDSRYTLAQMNAKYAKSISKLQRVLNKGVDRLVKLLYIKSVGKNVLINSIDVKLNPPVALILERLNEMFSNAGAIIEAAKNAGLPQSYFVKTIIPWLDQDLIDDAELNDKLDKIMKSSGGDDDDDDGGDGGGLF